MPAIASASVVSLYYVAEVAGAIPASPATKLAVTRWPTTPSGSPQKKCAATDTALPTVEVRSLLLATSRRNLPTVRLMTSLRLASVALGLLQLQ